MCSWMVALICHKTINLLISINIKSIWIHCHTISKNLCRFFTTLRKNANPSLTSISPFRFPSRQDGRGRRLVLLVSRRLQRYLSPLQTCSLLQPRSSQFAQVFMIVMVPMLKATRLIDEKYFPGTALSACHTRLADSQIRGESYLQHGT